MPDTLTERSGIDGADHDARQRHRYGEGKRRSPAKFTYAYACVANLTNLARKRCRTSGERPRAKVASQLIATYRYRHTPARLVGTADEERFR